MPSKMLGQPCQVKDEPSRECNGGLCLPPIHARAKRAAVANVDGLLGPSHPEQNGGPCRAGSLASARAGVTNLCDGYSSWRSSRSRSRSAYPSETEIEDQIVLKRPGGL